MFSTFIKLLREQLFGIKIINEVKENSLLFLLYISPSELTVLSVNFTSFFKYK